MSPNTQCTEAAPKPYTLYDVSQFAHATTSFSAMLLRNASEIRDFLVGSSPQGDEEAKCSAVPAGMLGSIAEGARGTERNFLALDQMLGSIRAILGMD